MRRYRTYDGWGAAVLPDPNGQLVQIDRDTPTWIITDENLRLALDRMDAGLMTKEEAYDWLANNAVGWTANLR